MPYIGLGWPRTNRRPTLRTLACADLVANTNLRHFRQTTRNVLRWYTELEDGIIQTEDGSRFDQRILDYRVDVDRVLSKFHEQEVEVVLLVNRDGLTHAQATTVAGVKTDRPDRYVADIEIRMGQVFQRLRLDQFLDYVEYLRS